MLNIRKFNDEVFYTTDRLTTVDIHDIEFLKAKGSETTRKRARLCTHPDSGDRLHEMLIYLGKGSYIRPHKHTNKSESFHIIEGNLAVTLFDDYGSIVDTVFMGEYSSGRQFYYRLVKDYFHSVVVLSGFVIFHETTNGPFNSEDTVYASWAPEENDEGAKEKYMDSILMFLARAEKGMDR